MTTTEQHSEDDETRTERVANVRCADDAAAGDGLDIAFLREVNQRLAFAYASLLFGAVLGAVGGAALGYVSSGRVAAAALGAFAGAVFSVATLRASFVSATVARARQQLEEAVGDRGALALPDDLDFVAKLIPGARASGPSEE